MPDNVKYKRFILVDKDGEVQTRTHQDDSEDPVVGDTLVGLLHEAADWCDMGFDDFVEIELAPNFAVLCEEVTRRPLNLPERSELALLIETDS